MNKFFVSLAVGGMLLGQVVASQALMITVTIPSATQGAHGATPGSPVGAPDVASNTFINGVKSDGGLYTASMTPSLPQTLTNKGTVSFGTTQIVGGPGSDNFTNVSADFTFDVLANAVTHQIQVNGHIDSTFLNPGGTDAAFIADSLQVDDGAIISTVSPIPTPGPRPGVVAFGVDFGGTPVDIYVEQSNNLTQPNAVVFLSVGGFVNSVPEPGSLAMLVGSGITGSLLLVRRRRA